MVPGPGALTTPVDGRNRYSTVLLCSTVTLLNPRCSPTKLSIATFGIVDDFLAGAQPRPARTVGDAPEWLTCSKAHTAARRGGARSPAPTPRRTVSSPRSLLTASTTVSAVSKKEVGHDSCPLPSGCLRRTLAHSVHADHCPCRQALAQARSNHDSVESRRRSVSQTGLMLA